MFAYPTEASWSADVKTGEIAGKEPGVPSLRTNSRFLRFGNAKSTGGKCKNPGKSGVFASIRNAKGSPGELRNRAACGRSGVTVFVGQIGTAPQSTDGQSNAIFVFKPEVADKNIRVESDHRGDFRNLFAAPDWTAA